MKPLAILTQVSPAFHAFLREEARKRGTSMSYLVRESVISHFGGDPALMALTPAPEATGAQEERPDAP